MRISKPAAMCMTSGDVYNLLVKSVPDFMPGFDGLQKVFAPFFATELYEARDLVAYIPRLDCEVDTNYRQFIMYAVIRTENNKVLVYNRQPKGSDVGEAGLAGAASIGFGGHIELMDYNPNPWVSLRRSMQRELREELYHHAIGSDVMFFEEESYHCHVLGVIHSNASDVDKVHLAVVMLVDLPCSSEDLMEGTLYSKEPDQVRNLRWVPVEKLHEEEGMEGWSSAIIKSNLLIL